MGRGTGRHETLDPSPLRRVSAVPGRVPLQAIPSHVGEQVRTMAWVETVRDQKKIQFVILSDRSGQLQAVHFKPQDEALSRRISSLLPGSVVEISGGIVESSQAKLGVEMQLKSLEVVSPAKPSPITGESSPDLRMDHRHLDLRRPEARLIFEAQTTATAAMREWWNERGLIELHSPKLMASASESGAEVFSLDYFGGKAYLAQSPQFYKQMAMSAGFEGVYEIGPVFRAERSYSARHATEYTSVDAEISWIDGVEDVMCFEEDWLRHVVTAMSTEHGESAKALLGVDLEVPRTPFPRVTLEEAGRLLAERGHSLREKGDLDGEGEKLLAKILKERTGSDFVFVTDWPVELRPFYHMRDGEKTRSFDLLAYGLEITTGAQREHRADVLRSQAQEAGLGSSVAEYLESFEYGCPPHGGFGLGLSRLMMVLLGQEAIRETSFLSRTPGRLTP